MQHKFDLWLNLKAIYDDYYDDSDLRDFPPSPPKTKRRKPQATPKSVTLTQAIVQARKAGVNAGVITLNGVTLEFGERTNTTNGNDLDSWIAKHHAH